MKLFAQGMHISSFNKDQNVMYRIFCRGNRQSIQFLISHPEENVELHFAHVAYLKIRHPFNIKIKPEKICHVNSDSFGSVVYYPVEIIANVENCQFVNDLMIKKNPRENNCMDIGEIEEKDFLWGISNRA